MSLETTLLRNGHGSAVALAPGSITEVLEAHEFAPKCEAHGGCEHTANWFIQKICKCSILLCADCYARTVKIFEEGHGLFGCKCMFCGHEFGPVAYYTQILLREVPL